jgi:6-phosphogluconolactonase (cycloisomerase 2 family)
MRRGTDSGQRATIAQRRLAAALAIAIFGLLVAARASHAALPLGQVTQLPGPAGCFTFDGNSSAGPATCGTGHGVAGGESATVSPDGANVYVGSYDRTSPVALQPGFAIFSRATDGSLTQLPGTAGCLTADGNSYAGTATCTKIRGFANVGDGRDLAITSDGMWAYMAAQNNKVAYGGVLIFQRDPATGALTQLPGAAGCITANGASQDGGSTCQTDTNLHTPSGVTLSPDDRFLYVVDYFEPDRLHVFSRDPITGALTDVECLAETPAPAGCSTARVLANIEALKLSPDGMHAYGGDYSHGLSVFDRNPVTGLLTQKVGAAGCVTDDGLDDTKAATCAVGRVLKGSYPIQVSPDGQTLYDPASTDRGFSVFHIEPSGELVQLPGAQGCVTIDGKDNTGASTCATARAIDNVYGAALSPDGRTLYLADDNQIGGGVAVFSLAPPTGIASQLEGLAGCITSNGQSNGKPGECGVGRALNGGYGMSLSPDGSSLYEATYYTPDAGLAVFQREAGPVCHATSAGTAFGVGVTVALACADADNDPVTRSIATAPIHGTLTSLSDAAGTVVYTPAAGFSGIDSFTFLSSDGVNATAPATATITVGPPPIIPLPKPFTGAALASTTLKLNAHGGVALRVSCPSNAPGGSCAVVADLFSTKGTLPVHAARRRKPPKATLLGRGRFKIAAGTSATVTIPLNRAGKALARHHTRLSARLLISSSAGAGRLLSHTYRVTIVHTVKRR